MEEDPLTSFSTMIRSDHGRGGVHEASDGRVGGHISLLPSELDDYSSSDGEDDVFIPSANGDTVGLATKVLLHPRRKSPSGGYQVRFSI